MRSSKSSKNRRIVIDYLVQDLVQQESGAALAGDRSGAQQLLHVVDAAKHIVMISDYVVRPRKPSSSIVLNRSGLVSAVTP